MAIGSYYILLVAMAALAVVVFLALQRVDAGYGMLYTRRWGPAVDNRVGWVAMEAPVFVAMALLWALAPAVPIEAAVMASLFQLHYFQRSFVFPLLIRTPGRMPLSIIAMGVVFNLINAAMQGGWLFYFAPAGYYGAGWLCSWQFVAGTALFLFGMGVNIHSDHVIRCLRKPGDRRHYLPSGGMFRWVSSANYFGEVAEWAGFALLTWSWAGAVFALWTFANLAPRARRLRQRYAQEFGELFTRRKCKAIIPYIY